jgi:hypothetical protein
MHRSFSLGYSGIGRKCAENRGKKLRAAGSIYAAMISTTLFHTFSHFVAFLQQVADIS